MKTVPKSEIRNQKSELVLFAVTGMSPAIITETVWALATNKKTPVIPDRVVVVTTVAGRKAIEAELFAAGVWDQLREALADQRVPIEGKLQFGTTANDIRVFTRADARGRSMELEDIRSREDNDAAANFLLDKLREFTENEDVRLLCSLAGGRKTMGALLYACLSLIGREDDRLTHVLVNEPYDDPRRQPKFYFPTPRDRDARVELADVPFVPLRKLFPRELGRMPGSFMNLVRQYRATIDQLAAPPRVELADDEPVVRVDGRMIRLPATAFALLSFLVERARHNEPPFPSFKDAVDPFRAFLKNWASGRYGFQHDALQKLGDADDATLRKLGNAIGTALAKAGMPASVIAHLRPHRGCFGIRIAL